MSTNLKNTQPESQTPQRLELGLVTFDQFIAVVDPRTTVPHAIHDSMALPNISLFVRPIETIYPKTIS